MAEDRLNELSQLVQLGFAEAEASRLIVLRRRIAAGSMSETLLDHKRLGFVRWLVERRTIGEWLDS
jgi:hypothetical protein